MQAYHFVAGYEYKSDLTNIRGESYYKKYSHLPLDSLTTGDQKYTAKGFGYAYGADFFIKGNFNHISAGLPTAISSPNAKTLSYPELVPTDFDIRHKLTIAHKMNVRASHSIGLTYHYTSGKPFTPSLGSWNAGRLPPIQRMDLAYSYYTYFREKYFLVFYISVANLLDRRNIYGYYYSPDYSQRTELRSTYVGDLLWRINIHS
jgi:hypothetical protein